MPIYIDLNNLIITKNIIANKYKGGLKQFCHWFDNNKGERWQEDKELFSIVRMNIVDGDIEHLVETRIVI